MLVFGSNQVQERNKAKPTVEAHKSIVQISSFIGYFFKVKEDDLNQAMSHCNVDWEENSLEIYP